ncbi:hypothetical protein B0H16DRAFT_1715792 [Mycena metata]|uniref:F-box domain-containing protein n=1 Tax=Mycena metata TaxID=1033252 RepID=A0AAD7JRN1_9AGAR|nr:hypothetical protein B0H16DRAFT_1715792 [Mycena metata]
MASLALTGPARSSASALRTRLSSLDDEMDALEARLRLLSAERRRVLHDLDSIVYPVLTLPAEITTQIFSHYVDDPHIGHTQNPGRGPLTLASVCRSWRDLSLSAWLLWSSLRIYPLRNMDGLPEFLACWLQRAGNHPLNLQVVRNPAITVAILPILSQYSAQLRTLSLVLDRPYSLLNTAIRGSVASLEKLALYIIAEGDNPVLITAFHDAPRLRQAELSGASLDWIQLPWIQLTHLHFSNETLFSLIRVLELTKNLEVLVIPSFLFYEWPQPQMSPVALHHLHALKFGFDRDGLPMNYLTLPAIKHLQLSALNGDGVFCLRHFSIRSQFSLQSICLTNMRSQISNECLQLLPSLEQVEIQFSEERPDSDLDEFIELLNGPEFLPSLRVLALRNCFMPSLPPYLLEMLDFRGSGPHTGVAKLESFSLFFVVKLPELVREFKEELRPVADAGMEIVVE